MSEDAKYAPESLEADFIMETRGSKTQAHY